MKNCHTVLVFIENIFIQHNKNAFTVLDRISQPGFSLHENSIIYWKPTVLVQAMEFSLKKNYNRTSQYTVLEIYITIAIKTIKIISKVTKLSQVNRQRVLTNAHAPE